MASTIMGFEVADEDRERLDRLVDRFGDDNRSAFLHESLRVMEGIMLAEELREPQAYGRQKLAMPLK